MSKKEYIFIAAILRGVLKKKGSRNTIDAVVEDLCPWFQQDNPLFDAVRFREAVYRDHQ